MGCIHAREDKKIEVSLVSREKNSVEEDYDVKYIPPDQSKSSEVFNFTS